MFERRSNMYWYSTKSRAQLVLRHPLPTELPPPSACRSLQAQEDLMRRQPSSTLDLERITEQLDRVNAHIKVGCAASMPYATQSVSTTTLFVY